MKLEEYLAKIGVKPSRWAIDNGFPVPVITRYLNGDRGISLDTALRISEVTKGKVSVEDLKRVSNNS